MGYVWRGQDHATLSVVIDQTAEFTANLMTEG